MQAIGPMTVVLIAFNRHRNLEVDTVIDLVLQHGNGGSERLNNWSRATQLLRGGIRV